MRRPSTRTGAALAAAALLAGPRGAGAQGGEFDDVRIRTTPVARGLYMLEGRGGNIGVSVGNDGVLLIDDQFAPLTDRIRSAVAALSHLSIQFVLNTHWHGDHTGGNENFAADRIPIVAHENVRATLGRGKYSTFRKRWIPKAPDAALPVLTFDRSITFYWNEQEIHVFHVEHAHTDGDSIVHFRKVNALHMGDTFFSGAYPFIDLDTGGSVEGTIAAVEMGLKLSDGETRIIPGHGPLSKRSDLEAYRDVLVAVRDRVAALIAEGKDEQAAVAAKPSAEFDAAWGGGFIKPDEFVAIVHRSLSKRD